MSLDDRKDRNDLHDQPCPLCEKVCTSAPFGLVVVNSDYETIFLNDTIKKFAGSKEAIENLLADRKQPSDPGVRQFHKMLGRSMCDGLRREFDLDLPFRTGHAGSFNVQLSPLCTSAGGARAVAVWVRDVSGYRRMSDRLIAAEKMASLGAMASGVARHFNTIIGGLTAAVDNALTTDDPAGARRALSMTSEAIAGISKLTRSLMSFSEQDKRMDLADLTEVLLTFVQLVERPLAESGISVTVNLSRIPIIAVEANRMHQVLGNLLSNAEEAMTDGGEIILSLDCDEQWVWLDFADTGCGIKPEHKSLIFEPFFTTKGLLSESDAGNPGLGLSVAHGLVLEMGGEICVSQSEQGACMRIRFPQSS